MFKHEAKVTAIHAGLGAGSLVAAWALDMVSFGPTITGAQSGRACVCRIGSEDLGLSEGGAGSVSK